jgi:RHS repeat-associated protein
MFESWVGWEYDWPMAGYANVGRMSVMYDVFGTESYSWSLAGNLARKERQVGAINYVFQYGHDAGNRLRWRTFPDGDTHGTPTFPLQYDDAGRQTSGPGIFSSAAYTAWGALSSFTNGNGLVTVRSYDPARQWLMGVRTTRHFPMTCQSMNIPNNQCVIDWCGDEIYCGPGWFQCCQTPPDETIQDLVYTRDGLGRVRQVTGPFPYESWSYGFDLMGRLTQATSLTNAYYNQTWTYDDSGNILTNSAVGTYLYNAPKPGGGLLPHAVSNAGGTSYTYDANANMTGGRLGTMTWDGDGLPTAIGALRFVYDGNGRRLRSYRVGNSSTMTYYVENDYEVNQSVATKYFRIGDQLVAKRKNGVTHWLHTDHLGSVQAITDASGATPWRQQYHPYGEPFIGGYAHQETHAFTGERRDENGLIYLTSRYYDPVLDRFISPDDRVGSEGIVGLNPFAYAVDDPVNNSDPTGHEANPENRRGKKCFPCGEFPVEVTAKRGTKLQGLDPRFKKDVVLLLLRAQNSGLNARVTHGLRTYREQNALYRIGRTVNPGNPTVTNARGGQSAHNFGVAIDVGFFDSTGTYITNGNAPEYKLFGAIADTLGLEWGGKWTSFPDPSHVQIKYPPLDSLRARAETQRDIFTGEAWHPPMVAPPDTKK